MLVLSRKNGESIRIGDSIKVKVLQVRGGRVRLGVRGPPEVPIHREEVYRRTQSELRFLDADVVTSDEAT